jgi:hypothetical protein
VNQSFSPVISLSVCTFMPAAFCESESRQGAVQPDPDSRGMVRTMRSSKAPATSAPLPSREQPVTPRCFASILDVAAFCSSTSMIRLTPQAERRMPRPR